MLGMKTYPQDYIAACRARVDADLRAYREQVGKAPSKEFEGRFFNDQVLLLDYMFVHRLTGVEGKDGNPLNEVRILCNSIMYNNNIMSADNYHKVASQAGLTSIKLNPERSILKYEVGDEIKLKEADFVHLFKAFFAEIENRYL